MGIDRAWCNALVIFMWNSVGSPIWFAICMLSLCTVKSFKYAHICIHKHQVMQVPSTSLRKTDHHAQFIFYMYIYCIYEIHSHYCMTPIVEQQWSQQKWHFLTCVCTDQMGNWPKLCVCISALNHFICVCLLLSSFSSQIKTNLLYCTIMHQWFILSHILLCSCFIHLK